MEFITGKRMERRTFIQGMGASLALPFLDAMVPAGRMGASAADAVPTRLVAIEMVHTGNSRQFLNGAPNTTSLWTTSRTQTASVLSRLIRKCP